MHIMLDIEDAVWKSACEAADKGDRSPSKMVSHVLEYNLGKYLAQPKMEEAPTDLAESAWLRERFVRQTRIISRQAEEIHRLNELLKQRGVWRDSEVPS